MEALRYLPYLATEGWVVTGTTPFVNIDNYPDIAEVERELKSLPHIVAFDMEAVAKELKAPRSSNMVLLGAASPFIDIDPEKIEAAIRRFFARKGEAIAKANIAAFRA